MKYFLKPLGHCLTTAVMTSAMLRLYALPAVEAATPDSDSQPASQPATADRLADQASQPSSTAPIQAISPPENLPVESSAFLPTPTLDAEPPISEERHLAKPDAPAISNPDATAPQPDAPQKAKSEPVRSEPVRTVAGMRQVVEKRLTVIVEQDKSHRDTKWQQTLIYTVMQYAWTGRFDQARQIAQHPALSADLQADLQAKITMIQLERQPTQVVEQPGSTNQQAKISAPGRSIPSGGSSAGRSVPYTAISLGQQCPAEQLPVPKSSVQKPTASGKTTQAKLIPGMPAFVPALSQNLAARLVQLSQMPAQTAKQPAAKRQLAQKSSLQTPEIFAGVASHFQIASSVKPISAAKPRLAAQPQPVKVELKPGKRVAVSSPPVQTKRQFSTIIPALWNLDQILGTALDQSLGQSFEQFSFSLPDWISRPLSSNWDWNSPSPNLPSAATAQLENSSLLSTLEPLEQSLATPQFGRDMRIGRDMRKLPSLSPLAKLAAKPGISAKLTVTTPAKPVLYDAAALLATNCAQASLTHYSGDQVIDPASSKRMGWVNLMFPLPVAAVLTSAFGWRVHPISGALSFHTGMDLGAPMGTPVLAAAAGRVAVADEMGGYGLAVVVEAGNQRNLYAHLSGIAVQPGAQVAQGSILGWVGSTGNSTGPHLHFESQVATSSGWTTVDPIASATLAAARP